MRLAVSVFYFSVLLICTTSMFAQSKGTPVVYPSITNVDEQVVNAIQNQRLDEMEERSKEATTRVNNMSSDLANLTGSMNRFTGIGIGLGAALVALQGLQIILQVKRSGNTRKADDYEK